ALTDPARRPAHPLRAPGPEVSEASKGDVFRRLVSRALASHGFLDERSTYDTISRATILAKATNRLDAETDLLRKLTQLLDVQCAWLLLASCAAGLVPSEQAQELHSLGAEPATDLDANNDNAAVSGSGKLWVRLMPFSARDSSEGAAGIDIGAGVGVAEQERHDIDVAQAVRVAAEGIKLTAATAPARRKRQREPARLDAGVRSEKCLCIKAGVAEVLPCKDCSRAAADDKTPSPRNEEAVSCGGRAGKDDGEGVAPGRPVGCVAVGVGATQAEPAEPLGSWAARSVCGEAEAYRNSHLSRFIPILQCYMCMRSGKSKTAERRRGCSSLRARKAPSIAPCEACMIERANGINGEDGGV
ncbi:unnamed protein product, partial [Symbiodinium sp. KB8]